MLSLLYTLVPRHIFQIFPAIIYLFVSDLTTLGYMIKLFSDGAIEQKGKQTETIEIHKDI